jgi:type IV secretion system protein VirB6
MSAEIFEPLAQEILSHTNAFASVSGALVAWVSAPILAGVTIMVMWHGVNVMRGAGGNMHLIDVFLKTLRAFLVVSLALAGGAYTENVIGFATDLRTGLANLFSAASAGTSSYGVLDQAVGKGVDALRSMMPWVSDNTNLLTGNFTGLIGLASMAFVVGCIVVYAVAASANLLLIDFSMAIVFAVGPLFVACFAFESMAKFFDAWLGAVLKYTFTAVVIVAVLAMGNGIMESYCNRIAGNIEAIDFIGAVFGALGATGLLVLIALRAPEIAGNIVGGIGISALGPAVASRPLASINSAIKSGGRGAANAVAYGVGTAAGTTAGQRITQAVTAATSTSLGQRAIAAGSAAARFAKASANMKSGSVGSAYRTGAGGGVGVITGGRPLTPPNS